MIDWQTGPDNRWTFQKLDEILATRAVGKGGQAVSPLVAALPQRATAPMRWNPFVEVPGFAETLGKTYTDSLIVSHRGEIVFEHHEPGMTPLTRHIYMSVSKSFCGVLAGISIERGELEPSKLVAHYLPELADSAFGDATVQQVLDMTVALDFNEDYQDAESDVQRQDRVSGWRAGRDDDPHDSYAFLATIRKADEHGKKFKYSSADTDVLGWILERVTGRKYVDLLSDRLWSKIGMTADAYMTVDKAEFPMVNAGLCGTTRDLAIFGQAVLDGHPILPQAWLEEMAAGGDPALASDRLELFHDGGSYTGQFWHTGNSDRAYYGVGIHGQYVWIDPTRNLVISKLSSEPSPDNDALDLLSLQFFEQISHAIDRR